MAFVYLQYFVELSTWKKCSIDKYSEFCFFLLFSLSLSELNIDKSKTGTELLKMA